ncbi:MULTISPECIES: hypothetical protein [unclassified Snodgrassella]|uniref:hypothetical protein n=1 Tax=unclassified Snodgrassella TaxID=2625236 RepID=UPI0018DE1304|nr:MULTISPECIES: hypothetical protein [unclassified Snodgrassella]MBI0068124.1 hypothetical protein [Snodgrassella sp. M0110]MBI0077235.1 hypothetical protein [Snodgrassella sp. M0118]MBI0079424.1 hypothetical protein [Snodgrassella sp. M0112]
MLDIDWEPVDRKLIDENNLKFPRFYRNKKTEKIHLFLNKNEGVIFEQKICSSKPKLYHFEIIGHRNDLSECTEEELWQPIDVCLYNSLDFNGQVVIELPGSLGIVTDNTWFLVLVSKYNPKLRKLNSMEKIFTWNYVRLNISHTDGISIVEYQKKL